MKLSELFINEVVSGIDWRKIDTEQTLDGEEEFTALIAMLAALKTFEEIEQF